MTGPETPQSSIPADSDNIDEEAAEDELEELLNHPDNKFLTEREENRRFVEDFDTPATERLKWAKQKINERLERTLNIDVLGDGNGNGIEHISGNVEQVRALIDSLEESGREIGRGGDAKVLIIEDSESAYVNAQECYKIALDETVKRGRNSIRGETEMQTEFFELYSQLKNKDIGVPLPMYRLEAGSVKLIAMERLKAVSVDDLITGRRGAIPEWFDIDRFCDSLKQFIDEAHQHGLYHRDMHEGNIMIKQKAEWKDGEPMGYVIDFGLSGHGNERMDPYEKVVGTERFTYTNDYGIVEAVRNQLREWSKIHSQGG